MSASERLGAKQPRLTIVPLDQDEAKAWINRVHRHHPAPTGDKFRAAVADETGMIRGVYMAGRPVGRWEDDDYMVEVLRVATDGCPNANSALYGAARRAAFALGYLRVITYTLKSESGASLRASGYRIVAERKARSWQQSSRARPRVDTNSVTDQEKLLWDAVA